MIIVRKNKEWYESLLQFICSLVEKVKNKRNLDI